MKSFVCHKKVNANVKLSGTEGEEPPPEYWRLWTHVVNHEVHDGFGHQVAHGLVDDGHVGVDQVADGLHLTLQLRVHAVH